MDGQTRRVNKRHHIITVLTNNLNGRHNPALAHHVAKGYVRPHIFGRHGAQAFLHYTCIQPTASDHCYPDLTLFIRHTQREHDLLGFKRTRHLTLEAAKTLMGQRQEPRYHSLSTRGVTHGSGPRLEVAVYKNLPGPRKLPDASIRWVCPRDSTDITGYCPRLSNSIMNPSIPVAVGTVDRLLRDDIYCPTIDCPVTCWTSSYLGSSVATRYVPYQ